MNAREMLLAEFHRLAEVPDAVPRLRRFVLDLAVRGRLVPQRKDEGVGADALAAIDSDLEERQEAGLFREPRKAIALAPEDLPLTTPLSWAWVHLVKVAEVSYGFPFDSNRFNTTQTGRPLIRIRDIRRRDTEVYTDEPCDDYYLVRTGDYLVGMDGDFNVAPWAGPSALLNQRVARFRNWSRRVEPKFLAMPLQVVLDHLHTQTSQTTVKHLSAKQIGGVILPLPPLAEQRRIVAKVDELMALCDRLEEAQREREGRRDRLVGSSLLVLREARDVVAAHSAVRAYLTMLPHTTARPEHVEQLRQSIFELAMMGRLVGQVSSDEPVPELLRRIRAQVSSGPYRNGGGLTLAADGAPFRVPASWRWIRFGELVADADAGWSPRSEGFPRSGDRWGVLKVSAVSWEKFLPEENKQLLVGVQPRPESQVHAGDFLITRANTTAMVAKCVVVDREPEKLMLSDKIVRLRLADGYEKRFLCMVNNRSPHARAYYATRATGTSHSMKNVSREIIYGLLLPLPPLAEQRRIVAKVEELLGICDLLETQIAAGASLGSSVLDAILPSALARAV